MSGSDGLLTLAVTSSTGVMSVAIGLVGASEGAAPRCAVIDSVDLATDRRHAEELGPQLGRLLAEGGYRPTDVGRLAVDVGPGRFTGLRVGLATIRGLAFALGVPVVGATSLEILAAGVPVETAAGSGRAVTAVIDARRQEVFQQVFVDGQPAGGAEVGRPEDLAARARGLVLGDGFDRYRDQYLAPHVDRAGGPAGATERVEGLDGRHPRAADLLALAATGVPVAGTEIRPVYLREPDAKANIRTRPEAAAS